MFVGHSWRSAVTQNQLNVSRATAYRLRQLGRSEEKAELAFLDDRHGHPYKVTEPVQAWISEFCTDHPQVASSRVQSELQSRFGVAVSVSQVRGEPSLARSEPEASLKKLKEPQPVWHEGIGSLLLLAAAQQTGLLEQGFRPLPSLLLKSETPLRNPVC